MKLKSTEKGRKSIVALPPLKPKARSSSLISSSGQTPVYLNVYDLTPINGYLYWAGLGIFHSGLQVHGVEYAFGAHDFPTSGVFEVEPRRCPGFTFRMSLLIGTTGLDRKQAREFMETQSSAYNGDSYHLILKNCNHFCSDACYKLTGNKIPNWVNRLAKIGSSCNCILPETLKATTVEQDGNLVKYGCLAPSSHLVRSPLKSSLSSRKPERYKNKAFTKK